MMAAPEFHVRTSEKVKGRDRQALGENQLGWVDSPGPVVETFPATDPSRLLGLSFGVVDGKSG